MVMFGHTASELQYYFHINLGLGVIPWTAGVDLFFVISGFVIFLITGKRAPSSTSSPQSGYKNAKQFLLARVIRLAPTYYIFTTLIVATLLITPDSLNSAQLEIEQIINSYLFIPSMRHDGQIIPVLSVGWTLNYEMFFYTLFGLALLITRKNTASLVAGTLIVLVALGILLSPASAIGKFWSSPILLEFLAGMLIAKIYLSSSKWRQKLPLWPAILVFILGVGMLLTIPVWLWSIIPSSLPIHRIFYFGIPACLIVISLTILISDQTDKRFPDLLVSLGSSSYMLYLSHRFVLRLFSFLWLGLMSLGAPVSVISSGSTAFVALFVTASGCVLLAHMGHMYAEKPLLTRLRRKYLAASS